MTIQSDIKKKLWGDLVTDTEKIRFLLSGRAVETGIIAPAIAEEFAGILRERAYYKRLCRSYQRVPK